MQLSLNVNGRTRTLNASPAATLLDVLRDELGLIGTKEGCVEGECGACTVLVDGRPVDSCIYAAHSVGTREVTTIEGVGAVEATALQQAMIKAGAVQCGFCTPGFVMTLTALLAENPSPDEATIRRSLVGNICRCTGYSQIVDAVLEASGGER
ncbi:MAG TPA: (2Fe-2S)-binding protein [Acidimicrobiia bacterium]|nr:(2Fe-2S)-binding protein [Acidimicrobiia bacterium]